MIKRIPYIFYFFLLFTESGFSQELDTVFMQDQFIRILELNRNGEFEKAYKINNDLLNRYKDTDSLEGLIGKLLYFKSSIELNLGLYRKAIKSAKESIAQFEFTVDSLDIASDLNLIGVGYYYLSDYDSTEIYYKKAYELKKKLQAENNELAVSAYNLAMAYEDLEQPDLALKLYKEAEKYLLNDQGDFSFLPDVYVGIAHIYFYRRDVESAERYAEKAMDAGKRIYGEENPNMTFVYTSYSNILESNKKYKESIAILKKSLKIRENTYGKYHKWTCESYYDLAKAYALTEDYNQAEKYYLTAIEIGEKIQSIQYLSNARNSLAGMYIDQKIHPQKTKTLLLKALKNNIKIFGLKNDVVAENYLFLTRNASQQKNENEFFKYFGLILRAGNYQKNDLNSLIAPFEVLEALVLKGDWYEDQYQNTGNIQSLIKKFDLIDQEIALIKYSQKNFSNEKSKIFLANDYREVFEKGMNTCYTLFQQTKDRKYLEKAFVISESNRSTSLLEGLQDSKFKLYGEIPKELILLEKKIKKQLSKVRTDLYYEQRSSNPDKVLISSLLDERILVNTRLDSLHVVFSKDYPKYKSLKYKNQVISVADIQKELDADSQIVIYFLGEESLFIFNITDSDVVFTKDEDAGRIVKEIDQLKERITGLQDMRKSSQDLYRDLIKDKIVLNKKTIVFIPDNVLNYIPFEMLQNDQNKYLLEDFSISYNGSSRLYLELKNNFFMYDLPDYWVGFSPDYSEENQLAFSKREVTGISELTGGKVFSGAASSKENFLENNSSYTILHLAMHAEIDNENPMFNKLVFSDGDLNASEIYVSNSKADLAVLSACNTGFGKLEKGEGVMSMARAFHFSGVPAVIMSLWKVPDKETTELMMYFYKFLKEGFTKDVALQKAKLKYLKHTDDKLLKHPFYWSGFVLTGNNVALPQKSNTMLYSLGSVLLLIILFTGYKKFRN